MTERVECDRCGKKVNVRKDDTIAEHHWAHRGIKHRCEASETKYARHVGTFRCVGPTGNRMWVANCRCGESWTGPATADDGTARLLRRRSPVARALRTDRSRAGQGGGHRMIRSIARTARKIHVCDGCGRYRIRPGDRYLEGVVPPGAEPFHADGWSRHRECAHCAERYGRSHLINNNAQVTDLSNLATHQPAESTR